MQKVLKDIQKNASNRIRISLTEFKGHDFVDLRVYYEDEAGEYKPTKKGVAFNPDLISQVIDALLQAEKEYKAVKGQTPAKSKTPAGGKQEKTKEEK